MRSAPDIGMRKLEKLSNTWVPQKIPVSVEIEYIIGKAEQAVASTHHTEYMITGFKPGEFFSETIIIFFIQYIDFFVVSCVFIINWLCDQLEEEEVVVVAVVGVVGVGVVAMGGNESWVLN